MKLIDIVKELPWPDGAKFLTQDNDGDLFSSKTCDLTFSEELDMWVFDSKAGSQPRGFWQYLYTLSYVADDCETAIITHADWLAAQEQAEPKEREHGFYWVADEDGEWMTAEWIGGQWFLGHDIIEPTEIDERRIVRKP